MKVKDIVEKLNLQVYAGRDGLEREVKCGYCGDLLSEVMGKAPESSIWLTIQGHQNIIAVAILREISAIVVSAGYVPDAKTKEKADEEKVPLLLWDGPIFELAGQLFNLIENFKNT